MVNTHFITIEDYNSIIKDLNYGFIDYFTVSSTILGDDVVKNYDFVEVVKLTDGFEFYVANSLWTKGYIITDYTGDIVVTHLDNGIRVTGVDNVSVSFEISPLFSYNTVKSLKYIIEYVPTVYDCFNSTNVDIIVKNSDNSVASNVNVVYNRTYVTDNTGLVSLPISMGNAGLQVLYFIVGGELKKINVYGVVPCPVVACFTDNLYYNNFNKITFGLYGGEFDYNVDSVELIVNNIHYMDYSISTESIDEELFNYIFDVDLTGFYGDTVECRLIIKGDNFNTFDETFTIDCSKYIISDYNSLKESIEENYSVLNIYLDDDFTISNSIEVLNIENIVNIYTDSSNVLNINSSLFVVNGELNIYDCNFTTNGIFINNTGIVTINNCSFINCMDTIIKSDNGSVKITDSTFNNNKSVCISSNEDLTVYNTSFLLNDVDYVKTDDVAFISVLGGLADISYCNFNINLETDIILGLGYLFFYIAYNCRVNNILGSNLLNNESFKLQNSTGTVNILTNDFYLTDKNGKCMLWTVEDTNMVYSNNLEVR